MTPGTGKSSSSSARARRGGIFLPLALLAALCGLLGTSLYAFAAPDKQSKDEKKRQKAIQKETESPYKKWIDEEVPYIITDEERQAFKKLTTDEEREQFIEQFLGAAQSQPR